MRAGLLALLVLLAHAAVVAHTPTAPLVRDEFGLLPGEYVLPPGENCLAVFLKKHKDEVKVGTKRKGVCTCGGKKAHYTDEDLGGMEPWAITADLNENTPEL